jgi:hypothetical protein
MNGAPIRSCVTPMSAAAGQKITTIEAIGNDRVGKAVQAAWVKHDVAQCGYCQSGQVMSATALLKANASPPTPTSTRPWPATSAAAAPTPHPCGHQGRGREPRLKEPPCTSIPAIAADLHKVLSRHGPAAGGAAALERRSFLKVGAAAGFALGLFPLAASAQAPRLKPEADEQPSAFVRIDKDGTTTVTINRLDFGQGVQTGLPMVLAEELTPTGARCAAVHGDADPAYADPAIGMHLTGGSNSIKNSYTQYRELGRAHPRHAGGRRRAAVEAGRRRNCAPQNGVVIGPAASAHLWRTGRSRDEAAGAAEGAAEGPEAVPPDRQAHAAGSTRAPSPPAARPTASTCACPAC